MSVRRLAERGGDLGPFCLVIAALAGIGGALVINAFPEALLRSAPFIFTPVVVVAGLVLVNLAPALALVWLLVAILLPIQLSPYTLPVTALLGVYLGILLLAARRRQVPRIHWIPVAATSALGAAVLVSAVSARFFAGGSQASLKSALVFVFLMGISVAVPTLVRECKATGVGHLLPAALAVGMSAWTLYEYPARVGWLPMIVPVTVEANLSKAVVGAVAGAFVGGGPNTYAVFLLPALAMLVVQLRTARGRVRPLVIGALLLVALSLALTYSRGAYLAAAVALAWIVGGWARHAPVRAVGLALAIVFGLGYWAVSEGSGASPAVGSTQWRTFVADDTSVVEQQLDLPPGQKPGLLWIKLRAASGPGYVLRIDVDGSTIYLGRDGLPVVALAWVSFPIPNRVLETKSSVVVDLRLVGDGNRRDQYFEVEGSTFVTAGQTSRYFRSTASLGADLSPDPGIQTGTYLIQFAAPTGDAARSSPPTLNPTESDPLATFVAAVTDSERWSLWTAAVASVAAHPIFGRGFYSSAEVLQSGGATVGYANVHNEFLEFLVDSGAVGAVSLIAFFTINILWVGHRRRNSTFLESSLLLGLQAALVAVVFAFLFGSFLADSRIAGLLWFVTGLAAVDWSDSRAIRHSLPIETPTVNTSS
jgi:hypothetical protein